LAYKTFGKLNANKTNVVWVFHALTANANPLEWWDGLVGNQKVLDIEKYFVVCVNMPGSCYGSISPFSKNTETGKPFYHDFPIITIRDMANMFALLQKELGIQKIHIGIGGSMGGMQLLEWSIEAPKLFENIILLATNSVHSPWGIAFNQSQRLAIEADSTWAEKNEQAGLKGLATARSIALLSYRNYEAYNLTQRETDFHKLDEFKASSYQNYQGKKLTLRFNAFSYYSLTKSMDSHNLARGRVSIANALKIIEANALVIGIKSDILFPIEEQKLLAAKIKNASFACIDSIYGHDGFLVENEKIGRIIKTFLFKNKITIQYQKQN
jgi:homoserine O-acetyltransferase